MARITKPAQHNAQVDRFRELARALEADEDEAKFDETLKGVAKHKPEPAPKPKESGK